MKGGSIYLLAINGSKYMWFDVSKDKSHKVYDEFLVSTVNWHPDLEPSSESDCGSRPQFSYECDELKVRVDFSWICYSNNYKYVAVKESSTNPADWSKKRCKMMIYAIRFDNHPTIEKNGVERVKMLPLKKFSDSIVSDAFSLEARLYRRAYARGFLVRVW